MAKAKAKQQQLQQQLIKIQRVNPQSKSNTKSIKPTSKLAARRPIMPPVTIELRPLQPVRRSLLMRKALQPLLPPRRDLLKKRKVLKKVSKAKPKKRAASSTNALLLIKDMPPARIVKRYVPKSKKTAAKKSKVSKEPANIKKSTVKPQFQARANALGNAMYHASQRLPAGNQMMMPMPLPQPPMPHPPLPHLSGGITGIGAAPGQTPVFNGYGYRAPLPVKQTQTNIEVDVPLSTRLPIIDFISTDEFEKMYASKMHRVSKRQTVFNSRVPIKS